MEDAAVALKAASATDIPGYEISACSLNLSSYILSDVVLRTINESSASTGLELVHQTIYSAIGQRTGTLLNTELSRAASRVLKSVYREREVYAGPNQDTSFHQHGVIHIMCKNHRPVLAVYFFRTRLYEVTLHY